jgi:WNK lysine deficient protein kinase
MSLLCHVYRPGVKDLLAHEFFAEDLGLRLEIISREEAVASATSKVEFRLRVLDPKKRSNKHKENEAIQFEFDIQADNAEEVASEMVSSYTVLAFLYSIVCPVLRSNIVLQILRSIQYVKTTCSHMLDT